MRGFFFWGALPFLLPQALYVRRFAPRLPPAAGPTDGSYGRGRRLRLIGIGDSIIAGVGANRLSDALIGRTAEALATCSNRLVHWSAVGLNGANSASVLQQLLPGLPPEKADVIILSVGVNDVTALTRLAQWTRNIQAKDPFVGSVFEMKDADSARLEEVIRRGLVALEKEQIPPAERDEVPQALRREVFVQDA